MTQASPDNLRSLLERMETATKELNEAGLLSAEAHHQYVLAKFKVNECTRKLELIKEEIMAEKILIRASQ